MIPDRDWKIEIVVRKSDEPWRTIAHGFWRKGEPHPSFQGDPPEGALEEVTEIIKMGKEHTYNPAPVGDRIYQISVTLAKEPTGSE